MKSEKINQLLEELVEKLTFYRSEDAITFYAPYKFDLQKRIEQLEKQIKRIRDFAKENPNKEIEFEALQNLHSSLTNESHFATNFDKLSYVFVENSKNVVVGNTITGDNITIHIGDKYYYTRGEKKVEPIPRFLNTPFIPPYFLGREEDLEKVHQLLFSETNFLMLVNGQGGIGKTTFAAKYWERYQDEYLHLAFLFVENDIADELLKLALKLDIKFTNETREEQVERLLEKINNLGKPCLLVLDNANERENIEKNIDLLRRCPNFHILMTSRIDDMEDAITYKMNVLKENFPLELFKLYYPTHKEKEDALFWSFFDLIEGNTLVIEVIAKNLKEINSENIFYSLQDLLKDFEEKGILKLSEQENIKVHWQNFQKDKPETILKAMYDLQPLSDSEKQLLSIFSVLPAENIAYSSLITLLKPKNEREFSNTYLKQLVQTGWIERNYIQEENHYKISPVIQAIIRDKNEERLYDDCEGMMIRLIDKLDWQDNNINYHKENYKYTSFYSSYAESITNYLKNNTQAKTLLYERVGEFYRTIGNLREALKMYEKYKDASQTLTEQNSNNPHFKNLLAISYEKLGKTNQQLGKLNIALEFFEKRKDLAQQLYNEFPNNVNLKNLLAISYSKLGEINQQLGKLNIALEFFEKRNDLGEQLHKNSPKDVNFKNGLAISYSKLGEIYQKLGNLEKALEFFEKDLELQEQLYREFPNNVNFKNGLAVSYSKLGNTNQELGNLKITLEFFKKFNDLEKQLYSEFPNNVNFKHSLAISYIKLGYYFETIKDITKAISYYLETKKHYLELTEKFPSYADFQNNLNWVEEKLKELQ